jgi:hypothetical protein
MRTKKDSTGRVWTRCDGDGSWINGDHIVGCAVANGSRWSVWDGPHRSTYEYKTLSEAMSVCTDISVEDENWRRCLLASHGWFK